MCVLTKHPSYERLLPNVKVNISLQFLYLLFCITFEAAKAICWIEIRQPLST